MVVCLVYSDHRIVEFCMMAADKPCALVFSHLFVQRIGKFIDKNISQEQFSHDICLSNICHTSILDIGGHEVNKIIRHDLDFIKRNAPNLLILEMGSNNVF